MNNNTMIHDLKDLDLLGNDYIVVEQKLKIVDKIKSSMIEQKLTVRRLADLTSVKHPQIIRVTSGKNYNIETLIKILDSLGLEITITSKTSI